MASLIITDPGLRVMDGRIFQFPGRIPNDSSYSEVFRGTRKYLNGIATVKETSQAHKEPVMREIPIKGSTYPLLQVM